MSSRRTDAAGERQGAACALLGAALVACAPAGPGAQQSSAASAASSPGVSMTANVAPLALQLERSSLSPGLNWVELPETDPAGQPRRFVAGVPDALEALGPRPLVVFLHGGGGGERLVERLGCLVQPGLAQLAPLVVAPSAGRGEWWNEDETSYVLGLTLAAARDWPVQTDRIVIMGYSNGGIGTWFLARLYPEPFSAAIPMASNHTVIGESPLPVYALHGALDELFDSARVSEAVAALSGRGLDVRLHVKPGTAHFDLCSFVPELEAAAEWLERDVWSRPRPPG